MNTPAHSSIANGTRFSQTMVDQRPKFDRRKVFRRKLRRGRPAFNAKRQYWVR